MNPTGSIKKMTNSSVLMVNPSSLVSTVHKVANVILECRQAGRQVPSRSWLDEASICLHEFLIDLIDASQQPLA